MDHNRNNTSTPSAAATLYHVPRTISSPLVQILLELSFEHTQVHIQEMTFAELKTPSHLAINPMGTSPAFTAKDDVVMWESGAILDFLLQLHDREHRFHPSPSLDAAVWAKYLQIKQYIIATVYPALASLFLETFHKPKPDVDRIQKLRRQWNDLMGPVLSKWLGHEQYFLRGGEPSAVDFFVAKPLGNAHALGLLNGFPALEALYFRILNRPSYNPAYGYVPLASVYYRPSLKSAGGSPIDHRTAMLQAARQQTSTTSDNSEGSSFIMEAQIKDQSPTHAIATKGPNPRSVTPHNE